MQEHNRFPWFVHRIATNLSTFCPAGCGHCLWKERQQRISLRNQPMSDEEMDNLVRMAFFYGLQEIVASGGEPFARPETLSRLADACGRYGLELHAITSAVWATTRQFAVETLQKTGPWKRLAVSCDRFHQEHIPLRYCVNLVQAARELNIPISIATVDMADEPVRKLLKDIDEDIPVISQPLMGMAALDWESLEVPCVNMAVPYCEDGRLIHACCGDLCELGRENPLYLGTTTDLVSGGISEQQIALIKFLRLFGPLSLYKQMIPIEGGELSPFRSLCELCRAVFALPDAMAFIQRILGDETIRAKLAVAEVVLYVNTNRNGV